VGGDVKISKGIAYTGGNFSLDIKTMKTQRKQVKGRNREKWGNFGCWGFLQIKRKGEWNIAPVYHQDG